jgi:transposase
MSHPAQTLTRPNGGRLTRAQRVERDRAMAKAQFSEGKSWAEVAAEFGVSRATAKRSARELASMLTPVTEGRRR